MIIKIKQGGPADNSWRFHDDVHELGYATISHKNVPVLEGIPQEEQTGIQFEGDDEVVRETHFVGAALPETCLCLSFIDFNGKAHEVYTDATVYLLNDHGKTIERIS